VELEVIDELASARAVDGSGEAPRRANVPQLAACSQRYRTLAVVGSGCFGSVHLAEDGDGRRVAIKCVLPDAGREMREVELLGQITHPCIVGLVDAFEAPSENGGERVVHIVMEFLPQTLHTKIKGRPLCFGDVQVFSFQLLRSLAHLDGMAICHRDVKPENVLLDGRILKLADFGSAKVLHGGPSTSYICARWWRAPELILGCSVYTTSIDWWSCGCVVAEMMLGRPLFAGKSSWGQIEEIVRALGSHSVQQLATQSDAEPNQRGRLAELPSCAARGWDELLPTYAGVPEALELPARLLVCRPSGRLPPSRALLCSLFTSLTTENPGVLPPRLFDFTQEEVRNSDAETLLGIQRLAQSARRA